MSRYVRAVVPGGTFFLTLVTHRRSPIFRHESARQCLREAIRHVETIDRFDLLDIVLLPDHLHLILSLRDEETDFSARVSRIKTTFTRSWLAIGGAERDQSPSRDRYGYRGVWQKRFWEHTVRDEDDLTRCRAYIYFNPVKHRLCRCPHAWPWTTFHRAVRDEELSPQWQCICDGAAHVPPADVPGAEME